MAEASINGEEFNEAVAQDRATMIRQAAKQKQQDRGAGITEMAGAMSGKATQQALDKIFLNINNMIWGLAIMVIPLFGLTLLMSLLLVLSLFLKKLFTSSLESKGFEVKIGLGTMIYTWGTLFAQLLLTVIIYSIIYIIINPVDFGVDALGL